MNIAKATVTSLLVALSVLLPAIADTELPNSGTYFVVNRSSGEALQPAAASPGQNVFLYPFTKSGTQKWAFTRLTDPKTKKPTNRYNIRVAGEIPGLELQPHPVVADHTALISSGKTVFVLAPQSDAFVLKSVAKNGDALFIYPSPPMNTEARFGPNDDSAKFLWDVQPAN